MNLKFLELALDAGHVVRYHADTVLDRQTVGNHTYGVLCLVDYITFGEASPALMRGVLLHDVPEALTGDLPYTAKLKNSELKAAMDRAESKVYADMGEPEVALDATDYAFYKFCDLAEAGFQATRELSFGNRNALLILDKVCDGLLEQQLANPDALRHGRVDRVIEILNQILESERNRWES